MWRWLYNINIYLSHFRRWFSVPHFIAPNDDRKWVLPTYVLMHSWFSSPNCRSKDFKDMQYLPWWLDIFVSMFAFGELDASAIGTSCRFKCFINRLAPGSALILHHLHQDQMTEQLKNLQQVLQCMQSKLLKTSLFTKQLPEIASGVVVKKT